MLNDIVESCAQYGQHNIVQPRLHQYSTIMENLGNVEDILSRLITSEELNISMNSTNKLLI
mgnify:FL=1